jgi:type IV fimbrial biogenesis protein FimT
MPAPIHTCKDKEVLMYTAQRGTTLVEQLVVAAIIGISALLALPGLAGLVADAKRTAAINDWVVTVQLARSEAIKRRVPIAVCPSRDGSSCSAALEDWSQGWILFANDDQDTPPVLDHGETLLAQGGPPKAGQTLRVNRAAFAFKPFGMRSTNGSFVVCDQRGPAQARAVVVSPTGRPRVTKEKSDGKPLDCG